MSIALAIIGAAGWIAFIIAILILRQVLRETSPPPTWPIEIHDPPPTITKRPRDER